MEPSLTVHHDVVYHPGHPLLPFDAHLDWGIYSSIGQRVDEAAPRRFADMQILGQSDWKLHPPHKAARAPEAEYIYGGVLIPHYGHFICTSLSRLWHSHPRLKFVFHAPGPLSTLPPFIIECLSAAGLAAKRVVIFDKPTWIERLIVPAQAFVEQSHAHSLQRQTFWRIGDALASRRRSRATGPVYLSKTALRTGVSRIVNEQELVDELLAWGAEIVSPERLTLGEQVDLARSARPIITASTSAFHTLAFARPAGKRILLSMNALNSNQLIIDRLSWPHIEHVRPARIDKLGKTDQFGTEYRIDDCKGIASELLARALQ